MEGQRGRSGSGIYGSRAGALATAQLRRLQFGWAVSSVGGWVFFVALAVYAFDVGGATAVGAAALTRMVPAGLAAPLAGVLADRHSRGDVMLGSVVIRALVLGAIGGAVAASAPLALVLVLAALFTMAGTAHKPAQASLLPSLVETPHQMAASNAVWSAVDSGAFLAGALLSGALIATTSMSAAFVVTAGLFAIATVPIAQINRDPVPEFRAGAEHIRPLEDALDGFRQVTRDHRLRLVVGVLAFSTLVEGAIDVLVVFVAIHLLGANGAGVGWLNAGWGFGGVIGSVVALTLLRRGPLTAGLAAGGLMVGVPLMLIALAETTPVALTMLTLLGIGYALIEVAGLSLLQRLPSNDLLGRAFAVVESSYWITTGAGRDHRPAGRAPDRATRRAACRGGVPAPRGGIPLAPAGHARSRHPGPRAPVQDAPRSRDVRAAPTGHDRERLAPHERGPRPARRGGGPGGRVRRPLLRRGRGPARREVRARHLARADAPSVNR
jgi:MFS family permease